jgi:hypothetical protein
MDFDKTNYTGARTGRFKIKIEFIMVAGRS